ncbi:MAG TPA: hypothetical protein VFJ99_04785 [Solirubrobacterales bacterium]|nr:hypothetical protein [Solirubrobacterales bacterium]
MTVPDGVPGNGRAWELVSPAEPVGAQMGAVVGVAPSGDRVYYTTLGPLPNDPTGWPLFITNLAERGADGWSTRATPQPSPESAFVFGFGPDALNPDVTESVWLTLLPETVEWGLFRVDAAGNETLLTKLFHSSFRGTSADLQHIVFATTKHFLPADAARTEGESLYEFEGSTLRLVDVDGSGSLLSTCGSEAAMPDPISRDGRLIFFTTHPSCTGPARAYVREDGITTTLMSASECTLADCGPESDVSIVGVASSGASAFLRTKQKLTDDDPDADDDLYRYDVASGKLALLSAPSGTDLEPLAETVVASTDGESALFFAKSPGAERALYISTPSGPRLLSPSAKPFTQLSGDGRYALFATAEKLLPGDDDDSVDVYRYDAATESLALVSSGPTGGGGPYDASIGPPFLGVSLPSNPFLSMSDDGQDVFFGTAEQLVPQDRNQAEDAYEWRDGNLALLSAGLGENAATFVGTTPDGSTAMFRTTLSLLPRDVDEGDLDFYAARVGGGFAEPEAPAPTCEGDGCLPPLAEPVERPPLATARPAPRRLGAKRPGAGALRRAAATGRLDLLVELPFAGTLSARATAALDGHRFLVAGARAQVAATGPARLPLRLTARARRALAAGRDLRVRLVLGLPGASGAAMVLRLEGRGR